MSAAAVNTESRCAEFPEQEKRMTFQVAAIGTDGIVLGSDRRQNIYSERDADGFDALIPGVSEKLIYSASREFVVGFAGGPTVEPLARALAEQPRGALIGASLFPTVQRLHHEIPFYGQTRDTILLADCYAPNTVSMITRTGATLAPVTPITQWITTGSNSVPARFLMQHFWRKVPVDALVPLVLLTLHCACKEGEGSIGEGMDIVLLKEQTWQPLKSYDVDGGKTEELWHQFEKYTHSLLFRP
jgi:hypothetical protein